MIGPLLLAQQSRLAEAGALPNSSRASPLEAIVPSWQLGPQMSCMVYYDRQDSGDIIHHRRSMDGQSWTKPVRISHDSERNGVPILLRALTAQWWWFMTMR